MSYTTLAVCAVFATVLLDVVVLRTRLLATRLFWLSWLIIVGFQLLVNGALTGYEIVTYDPQTIVGIRIAFAPVEDLAFGFAMTGTTLMAWTWAEGRTRSTTGLGHTDPRTEDDGREAHRARRPRQGHAVDPFPDE